MARLNGLFDASALKRSFSPPTVTRSIWVGLIVGTILNLINQGNAIVGGKPLDFLKLLMTYAVPFFVASYGAYSAYQAERKTP